MTNKVALLLSAWLIAACARRHDPEAYGWGTRLPLAPSLQFAEAIAPRTLAVLVLDAHSGAPARYSAVSVTPELPTRGGEQWIGGAPDSTGVLRLRLPRAGRYAVHVIGIGYESLREPVAVTDTTGFALVVQLKRSYERPKEVIIGPEPARKPPK
jgi:hypothetical protein